MAITLPNPTTSLSSLAPLQTASVALSNLLLVTPQQTIGYQPQSVPQSPLVGAQAAPALLFHYEGEQTATLESDITDHYIETNIAIQDQIALRPETVTTQGFIGELNDIAPPGLAAIQSVANKLTTIGSYVPGLSATALNAYNEAFLAYQTVANVANTAVSAVGSLSGSSGESVINGQGISGQANQTKQQVMFQQFYGYWLSRTLFTVQTPWAIFQNMAIKSLRAVQSAETRMITDFEVTFKIIRTTSSTAAGPGLPSAKQARLAFQNSPLVGLGTSILKAGPTLASQVGSSFSNLFSGLG